MYSFLLIIIAASFGSASKAMADVYKYRDNEGRTYLTDKPMKGSYRLLKRFRFKGAQVVKKDTWAGLRNRRARFTPFINTAAKNSQLRPALVHAVVRAESAYRADAVSRKGAIGLMQLMPATARSLGVEDAYDPQQNLRGGTRYLSRLLKMFDYDIRLALAAYNAGENAVISYGNKIPPYPETQRYVEKVLAFYNEYRSDNKLAQR